MADDLKELIADGNKIIAALRGEVDGMKSTDVVQSEKIARLQTELAANLAAKQDGELSQKAMEKRLGEMEAKMNRPGGVAQNSGADEHKTAFLDYLRKGEQGGAASRLYDLEAKATDVRVATAASGGYALPKEIASAIAQVAIDISPIRSIARTVTTGTTDYHEIVDLSGFATEWLGETDTRNQTATSDLADVQPTFGELAAKPEATRQSISDLFFNVENWLIQTGGQMFAKAEGLAFVSGNGTNKPTGFLTGTPVATADASRAFGTLQYIATGQAATLATNPFDTMNTALYTLKAAYRQNAKYVMSSLTLAQLVNVKDSTGQYLMQPDVRFASGQAIGGKEIVIAEDMPIIAANAFPIALGDFQQGYLIADIPGMWTARDEITKVGWVRFPMAKRLGGKLKDTNAIKLIKIAAS